MANRKYAWIIFIAAGVLLAGVVFFGVVTASYFLTSQNYRNDLDGIKQRVAALSAGLEQGSGDSVSGIGGECAFYDSVTGEINSLSGSLNTLNGRYPLLFFGKPSQAELGIDGLLGKAQTVSGHIGAIRACADEDRFIAEGLANLLKNSSGKDLAEDCGALSSRNRTLLEAIAAFPFAGTMKEKLDAFADSVEKRGSVLQLIMEDSLVSAEYQALAADQVTQSDALAGKFRRLLARNDALVSAAATRDLDDVLPGSRDYKSREASIRVYISYLLEINQIQAGLARVHGEFSVDSGAGKRFTAAVADDLVLIAELKLLGKRLDDINGTPTYEGISGKRALENLGLTEQDKAVFGYENALRSVDSALAESNVMEKEIDRLLLGSISYRHMKIALKALAVRNQSVLSLLDVELPPELADGLARFASACRERANFIREFIGYIDDKVDADSYHEKMVFYQLAADKCIKKIIELRKEDPEHPELDELGRSAEANLQACNEYDEKYRYSMGLANTHKKLYEASRRNYKSLLD